MAAAKVDGITRGTDWAEDDENDTSLDLPQPTVHKNKDGTETLISYRLDEAGRKIKRTQRIRKTLVKTVVNPRVAERRHWDKFGDEKGKPAGPHTDTVSIGENIVLRLQGGWRQQQVVEEQDPFQKAKANLKDAKIKCRICSGEHWTSKCPFKDTMAPEGEAGAGMGLGLDADEPMPGVGSAGGSGAMGGGAGGSYVPPHLRGKSGLGTGERMSGAGGGGGKFERDDLATLRVTNVSEFAEENELRDMFSRFGHVTRVFLAKDRETNRAKGFAFISFAERESASKACEKMDGFGYGHLILRVEFAKKST